MFYLLFLHREDKLQEWLKEKKVVSMEYRDWKIAWHILYLYSKETLPQMLGSFFYGTSSQESNIIKSNSDKTSQTTYLNVTQ